MAEYTVLYNPLAGNGRGFEAAQKLRDILAGDGLRFEDMTKISDCASFIRKLPKGEPVIICGGDGTLNRFVNSGDVAGIKRDIYYYAAGSGNDFLHDIGKSVGDKPVCINEYIKELPEVTVNGHSYKFINGVGYGIDGYCCEEGDRLRAASDRPVNYTLIAIKGLLFHFKPVDAVVTVDGEKHVFKKVWLAPTMNGRFYGGGMMPTPDQSRLDRERKVSTMVFFNAGKLKSLMVFPSIFKGEHVKHEKMVQVLTGHDIQVRFSKPAALQIDGETITGVLEYSVTTKAAAARREKDAAVTA